MTTVLSSQPPVDSYDIHLESHYWQWQGYRTHYVQAGAVGPRLLLIHGFGASTDHWRKNMAELSQDHQVWAIDLLGFGRSQKPALTYTGELWRDQLKAFCQEVIQAPVVIAGNSLGGYAALCFAVDCPELTTGLVLLNCAGPFRDEQNPKKFSLQRTLLKLPFVIEIASFILFQQMRQRSKIREVLLKVYKDPTAVTDRLVEEIYQPAFDPGALGVFAAVFKSPPGRPLDILLSQLNKPLLLLWGAADPWMSENKAKKMQEIYPAAQLSLVDAGHCPHDERPEIVNQEIKAWVKGLDA